MLYVSIFYCKKRSGKILKKVDFHYHDVDNAHSFRGKKIEPPEIFAEMTVSQLIDFFGATGYNARRLAEAARMMAEMLRTKSTVCLTLGRGYDSDRHGQDNCHYDKEWIY